MSAKIGFRVVGILFTAFCLGCLNSHGGIGGDETGEEVQQHRAEVASDANVNPVQVLRRLGGFGVRAHRAVPEIRALESHPDAIVQIEALGAHARVALGNERTDAVARLRRVVAEQTGTPQARAACLVWLAVPEENCAALPIALRALCDSDPDTRSLAHQVLNHLTSAGVPCVPELATGLEIADPEIRLRVADILAFAGQKARPAARQLAARLEDPAPQVRFAVAKALLLIASEEIIPRLVASLRSVLVDPGLPRSRALEARSILGGLAGRRPTTVLPILESDLRSESPLARLRALRVIGDMRWRADPAVPAVRAALEDRDPGVREAAWETLESLAAECSEARRTLQSLAEGDDPNTRRRARSALMGSRVPGEEEARQTRR